MEPKVVHWKTGPFDIYIGRPTRWGNPFNIGVDGNRTQVIALYEEALRNSPDTHWRTLREALPMLRGKVLGCWCSPRPCHGDVLVKLANA